MENFEKDPIQRCPHDRENPYSQISRDLIRDSSISPECRWLIIYLLSMKDGWEVQISQIRKHLKGFVGRDKLYKIFEEAIDAGYMKRVETVSGNLNQGFKYYVSEQPKFKKCFRHPDFQDTENQDTENTDLKKEHSSSLREEVKKEHKKERGGLAPPPPAPPVSVSAFGSNQRVRMKKEELEKLIQEFGEAKVLEKIEALDEYADIKPKEFKKYGKHAAVLRNWLRKDLKNISAESKKSNSELNEAQKANLKLNDELVNELKLECPDRTATMSIFYKHYLLKSKDPYFDISMLVDHKEFCRFLEKHLGIKILEVRFPHG